MPCFEKKPEQIEALLMVMMTCCLVVYATLESRIWREQQQQQD